MPAARRSPRHTDTRTTNHTLPAQYVFVRIVFHRQIVVVVVVIALVRMGLFSSRAGCNWDSGFICAKRMPTFNATLAHFPDHPFTFTNSASSAASMPTTSWCTRHPPSSRTTTPYSLAAQLSRVQTTHRACHAGQPRRTEGRDGPLYRADLVVEAGCAGAAPVHEVPGGYCVCLMRGRLYIIIISASRSTLASLCSLLPIHIY